MDDHDAGSPPPPDEGTPAPAEPPAPASWRLTFEYEGDTVRLVGRQQVEMQAPPDESSLVEGAEDGYWVEVRDSDDQPVYRQVLHEPIQTEYEVFSPEGSMRHVAAPEVKGVFQTVVPDLASGDAVVLHGPSAQGPGGEEEGTEPPPEGDAAPPPSRRERRARGPRTLLVAPLRGEVPPADGGGDGNR